MARKAGSSGGATESGQRPLAGQEPEARTAEVPALDPVDAPAARIDEDPPLSTPHSDPTGPDPTPPPTDGSPFYGDPVITVSNDSAGAAVDGGESIFAGESDSRPGQRDDAEVLSGEHAAPVPPLAPERADWGANGHEPPSTAEPSRPPYEYASPPAVEPPPRRRGVGGLLLGGALAAALGFGAAYLAQDQLGAPQALLPADLEERLAALEARPGIDTGAVETLAIEDLTTRLSEVETRVAELEAAPASGALPAEAVDLGPLREQVEQGAAETGAQFAALEERLAVLENRPAPPPAEAPLGSLAADPGPAVRTSPEALSAGATGTLEPRLVQLETGLSAVQDDLASNLGAVETVAAGLGEVRTGLNGLDARLGQVETSIGALDTRLGQAEATGAAATEQARAAEAALAEAEARSVAVETQARAGAALAQLDAALDGGEPFEALVSDLQATGVEVPAALATTAAAGVPSLAALRESFPESSRAALAQARAQGLLDEGGLTGFLSSQLSLRSTAPREGSDVDAVLSRAESALAQGRLDEALAEIEALPPPVREAMGDWVPQAQTRAGAVAALATLRAPEPNPAAAD